MNKRISKKRTQDIILTILKTAVTELDELLFPARKRPVYKVHIIKNSHPERITVHHHNNIKFEVRADEGNHVRPHFHVTLKNKSASISLDSFEVLSGELDNKTLKQVLLWAKENKDSLVNTWERFHGSIVEIS